MKEEFKIETVLLKGTLHFFYKLDSTFKGPIRRGFRPIAWYKSITKGASSCSIISDVEIQMGESKETEIVLLNQLELDTPIEAGMVISIGTSAHKIAEFTVKDHLGFWVGKVP